MTDPVFEFSSEFVDMSQLPTKCYRLARTMENTFVIEDQRLRRSKTRVLDVAAPPTGKDKKARPQGCHPGLQRQPLNG